MSEIVNLRRARKQKNRERQASGSGPESRRLRPLEGREASHRERARARRGQPRRPPADASRWRLTARDARVVKRSLVIARTSHQHLARGCVLAPAAPHRGGAWSCPSIGWRRWSTPRAAAPICHRPSECSCSRRRAPDSSRADPVSSAVRSRSVELAWRRVDLRRPRLRPRRGRRGRRRAHWRPPRRSSAPERRERGVCRCRRRVFGHVVVAAP